MDLLSYLSKWLPTGADFRGQNFRKRRLPNYLIKGPLGGALVGGRNFEAKFAFVGKIWLVEAGRLCRRCAVCTSLYCRWLRHGDTQVRVLPSTPKVDAAKPPLGWRSHN